MINNQPDVYKKTLRDLKQSKFVKLHSIDEDFLMFVIKSFWNSIRRCFHNAENIPGEIMINSFGKFHTSEKALSYKLKRLIENDAPDYLIERTKKLLENRINNKLKPRGSYVKQIKAKTEK